MSNLYNAKGELVIPQMAFLYCFCCEKRPCPFSTKENKGAYNQ